ncbi:1001_t:CDS:2 [Acaulospora colombiana]|uniref:1001_t:CDS:1 n=1 Tax=Acaulospora colombiana TaxID=27376 RepID=A0ACA9JV96_9GLOM|nr:1001_t:CDS:2 [Acaulospora colombiana]
MPARKKVSVESDSSHVPNGTSSATSFDSSNTSLRNPSRNSSKQPSNPKINLVFSKRFTFPMSRSAMDYEKLPKFIDETLRYINSFNYPYEMFYELNGEVRVFSSRTDDTMKALKDVCESDEGKNVDSVYILAEKAGVKTFLAYNVDFVAFVTFLLNLLWYIFVGSRESRNSAMVLGVGLCIWVYWKLAADEMEWVEEDI